MKALGFEGFSPSWKFVAGRHRGTYGFARAPQVGCVLSRSCSLLRAAVVQWSAHRADDRGGSWFGSRAVSVFFLLFFG